jgi:hypothetical protein
VRPTSIARSKTTVAEIGLELLRLAGLSALLADDESTPQAFLRSLTHQVPANYGCLSAEERQIIARQLSFSAQRGWFESVQLKIAKNNARYASKMMGTLRAHHRVTEA